MKTSERIETEIEQTRGAMSDTLQAIERKLSPNRLVDEAMQTMRNIDISNSRVLDVIRDHPLPVALTGLGLGWLALAALGSGRQQAAAGGPRGVAEPPGGWAGYGAAAGGGGNGSGSELSSAEDEEGALDSGNGAGHLGRKIGRLGETLRHRAGDIATRGTDVFQDHPVAVGLLAMAAGLALGLAVPRSRRGYDLVDAAAGGGEQVLRTTGKAIRHAAAAVGEGAAQTMQRASEALRS
ncbi:MAG TPA: DUF3618 domain-containing protein [Rhodospirillaceae bacterium]|nr:DUF3618 domain-containing protein [Rhodospirillaceae bacterium]